MGKVKGKNSKKAKNINRPKSRKETRKINRKLKKQKKLEYYINKRKPAQTGLKSSTEDFASKKVDKSMKSKEKGNETRKNKPSHDNRFKEVQSEKRKEEKLKKEMMTQRKKQLLEANVEEDRNIRRLEKLLKLNKRKSKSIPKAFVADGLDYLLEICDDNFKNIASAELQFNEANDDFEEDFELMTGKTAKKRRTIAADAQDSSSDFEADLQGSEGESDNNNSSEGETDNESSEDLENYSGDDDPNGMPEESLDENERYSSEQEEMGSDRKRNNKNIESEENHEELNASDGEETNADDFEEGGQNRNGTWEDIYGRLRNKDGSIITKTEEGKYVPPALRQQKLEEELSPDNSQRKERQNRLKKQLKGLLNRLAEANMHSISNEVEKLYMANSRNDMNDTITNLMVESLAWNVLTPERLLLEHVMLITILHANIGTEIGAHFLQEIIKRFENLFNTSQEVEDKTLDNIVNIIAQLYNFKVFDARLLYDILAKLSAKFNEKSVECILLILKNVGFSLRKDDPLALKSLILGLQKQAANVTEETKENSRVKFMLDILLAIKNNNVSKIPNYDTTYSEHLKKILKSFVRKGNYVSQLKISLDDLLKAETRGKWWIVGSAWTGDIDNALRSKSIPKSDGFSQKLLDLARKHHMNTDTRRSIFCIIMSAEDYLDAFEKLLRLGLKNQQEREIIHVILHCCLQEKDFNAYYAILAQKFCDHDRKFQMMIKFSVWDKLKALTECSATQLSNLAKMLTHLFLEKGLPISTLKIVQFSELDKIALRFLRQTLLGVLLSDDTDTCIQVFGKISHSDKLKLFRESLRLFIHHFLLKNLDSGSLSEQHNTLLKERVNMVEKLLSGNEKKLRF